MKISLPVQILIGMILGFACGIFFGEMAGVLEQLGEAFIMLLKMTIIPYMCFALIHAIGSLSRSQFGQVVKRAFQCYIVFWALILVTVYGLSSLFPESDIASYHGDQTILSKGENSLLKLFIPVNPFYALANDIIPAIVMFSLLFGIALMQLEKKEAFLHNLKLSLKALISITRWVTKLSPIGVFALIASSSGTLNLQELDKLGTYILAYAIGVIFLCFCLFPLLIQALTPVSYQRFLMQLRPAILLSFTTANTLISLPHIITAIEDLVHKDKEDSSADNTIESLVPIAYNFPTIGNLFVILFILFVSSFYAQSFTWDRHLYLLTLGIPVLFGSGNSIFVAISLLIDRMHLPIDGLSLFLQTVPFTRNFQTMASTTGIAVITLFITFAVRGQLRFQLRKVVSSIVVSVLVFFSLLFIGSSLRLKIGGDSEVFSSLKLIEPLPHTVYSEIERPSPIPVRSGENRLKSIQGRETLRVGFNPNNVPFCYFNKEKELVGFDIQFAHELAKAMGCKHIDFIPFSFETLTDDIQEGLYDIAVGSISVNSNRLRQVAFSSPYIHTERGLVVKDYLRHDFAKVEKIRAREDLELAVLEGSTLVDVAKKQFPNARLTPLKELASFKTSTADALLWTEDEGTTWSLIHPEYSVVIPSPSLGSEHYAYALHGEASHLLEFVNYWLNLTSTDGKFEEARGYWILGQTPDEQKRWSVIRDVLHWVD